MGEGDFFVGDDVAFGVGEGLGGDGDEAGARESVQQHVECAAVAGGGGSAQGACGEFGVELAGGGGAVAQCGEDGAEMARLLGRGRGEVLRGAGAGGAEVAFAAGAVAVCGVAEVLDDGGHAALLRLREGGDAVELGAAEGDLGVVSGAPGCGTGVRGATHVAGYVDGGRALRDELLHGLLELVGIHLELAGERVGHQKLVGQRFGDADQIGGGRVVALEEELVQLTVGIAVEEDGARGQAVAAGAADLLVEGLDGGGQRGVDDGAHIGLVDAHAEGDGGDDDGELAGLECGLHLLPDAGLKTGVVGGGGVPAEGVVEFGGELLRCLARGRVDDGRAAGGVCEECGGELMAARLGHLDDFNGEVGAAEAMDKERRVGELELGDDIALHGGRGGGGEGDDGGGAECGKMFAEGAVVGAEVVSPGADAVRLVDGDEGGLAAGKHLREAGNAHALGRDEEEVEGAVEIVAAGLAGVVAAEAGVDAGDAEAKGGELGGLVVHERDEWGDDERGAAAGDGGKLVAERLACAGGHDQQHVAAVCGGAADGLLVGAKAGEAEGGVEEGFEIHAGSRHIQFRMSVELRMGAGRDGGATDDRSSV